MPDRTVNPRYVSQAVTVAANVAASAPTTTTTAFGLCILESIQVWIPEGHAGLTGLAVELAGVHLVPFDDPNAFILGDGTQDTFEVGIQVDRGLTLRTYNTDQAFPHTFYLRWKLRDATKDAPAPSGVVVPIRASVAVPGAR